MKYLGKSLEDARQQVQDLINNRCPDAPPALFDLIDVVFDELKYEHVICLRCGADKKQVKELKIPCNAYGTAYGKHMWK